MFESGADVFNVAEGSRRRRSVPCGRRHPGGGAGVVRPSLSLEPRGLWENAVNQTSSPILRVLAGSSHSFAASSATVLY